MKLHETIAALKDAEKIGLMTHVVVGYPTLDDTRELISKMVAAGVTAIELQIPFSDPLGDGPTIMHANQVALEQGITPGDCITFMSEMSTTYDVSFIFMTYFNIIHTYGIEKFMTEAAQAGAASVIVPDALPNSSEGATLYQAAKKQELPIITVVAPRNSTERLTELIAQDAFEILIYLPRYQGVTGADVKANTVLQEEIALLHSTTNCSIAVGFGVSTKQDVEEIKTAGAQFAVIGSKIIRDFETGGIIEVAKTLEELQSAT